MLLGYARGAVGNLVFSRVKGNEVTKARNRQPANPKTSKQVYQRAKFLNAVNFYKRGVQNLFKFAYEDKTQQESDFNAFMRHNVSRAVPVGKTSSTDSLYPAVSNWITSVGSLNGPQAVIGFADDVQTSQFASAGRTYACGQFNVSPTAASETAPLSSAARARVSILLGDGEITTFGGMCASLKSIYPDLQEGDIVTVTLIHQIIQGIGEPINLFPSAYGTEGYISSPAWKFAQFIIDSTSTVALTNAVSQGLIYLSDGLTFETGNIIDGVLSFGMTKTWQQWWDELVGGTFDPESFTGMSSCAAGVVTFSRNTTSGLRVSTQELSTSEGFQQLIQLSQTTAFTEQILRSWDAADMAILEGGFIQA